MQEKFNIKYYKRIRKILNIPFIVIHKNITGLDNIPNKPYILAGNHKSLMDIPLLITSIGDDIHFMAKCELFDSKIFSAILDKMGAFPVDRQKIDLKAIKEALLILRSKKVLGIFPEGTRNNTNQILLPFKDGVSSLATKTNSLIVPFGISGEYKIGHEINLNIGKAIDIKSIDKRDQTPYLEEQVKELILKK